MEHAWIVDAVSGCVVERTWDNNADQPNTYLGFGIPADITADALRRSKGRSVSVLFGEWARDGWFHRNHLDATAVFTAALSSSLPG